MLNDQPEKVATMINELPPSLSSHFHKHCTTKALDNNAIFMVASINKSILNTTMVSLASKDNMVYSKDLYCCCVLTVKAIWLLPCATLAGHHCSTILYAITPSH